MTPAFLIKSVAIAACLFGASTLVGAQPVDEEREAWREADVRLPEKINLDRVVSFELNRTSSLHFGIEPDTLRIDADGVVRYAFVARSASGALNVLFEGIRCQTGEVKLYAHWDKGTGWTPVSGSAWAPLSFQGATRRAMQMAKGGVCAQRSPNGPPEKILETLRRGNADLSR